MFFSARLKSQSFAFKICPKWISLMKNEFSTLLQPNKLILIAKRCPFYDSITFSQIAVLIYIFAAFEVKKCQRSLIQDTKVLHLYYFVSCLLKISKNWHKKRLIGYLWQGVHFFWSTLYTLARIKIGANRVLCTEIRLF